MSASTFLDALAHRDDDQEALDRQMAAQERRANRARQMMAAADVILLGHDDAEDITLTGFNPADYADLPGVRHL